MRNYNLVLLAVFISSFNSFATIISVPTDHTSIQAAINAAANGDTIVVAPGTYYENINFRGKNVFLTSQYYLSKNTSFINSTIIDGSTPVFPDTASCVIFSSGESASAILQGFTIRGGKGTKWLDAHGAGKFREGGGILIENSSPTIIHNIIRDNACSTQTGVVSAGGGGVRIGDGNPTLCSNIILANKAAYGPGIVLNYTGGKITNNIIVSNSGGNAYGGGSGIWAIANYSPAPLIIENNTIANNVSTLASATGGLLINGCNNILLKNNIVYGNTPALQMKVVASTPTVTYCDIQGGYTGTGNINVVPGFSSADFYLGAGSPCIDAGDPATTSNDIQDPGNPGMAKFPSLGTIVNDMGAYGGQCASEFPPFTFVVGLANEEKKANNRSIFPNPVLKNSAFNLYFNSSKHVTVSLVNMLGESITTIFDGETVEGSNIFPLQGSALTSGTYFVKVSSNDALNMYRIILVD